VALYALELATAGAGAVGATTLKTAQQKLKIASILLGAVWCAQTGSLVKRWALGTPTVGARVIWNRLLDFALGAVAALVPLELVARELNVILGSIVAVGGISGIVVALAAKEPLSELLNDLVLALSSKIRRGRHPVGQRPLHAARRHRDEIVVGSTRTSGDASPHS